MAYVLLIHEAPDPADFARLSDDERHAVTELWKAIGEMPEVTPGMGLEPPAEAVTVRSRDGQTQATEGPFQPPERSLSGYLLYDTGDRAAAVELAGRISAANRGGAVEVRPVARW